MTVGWPARRPPERSVLGGGSRQAPPTMDRRQYCGRAAASGRAGSDTSVGAMSDLSWYLRRFRRLVAPPGRPAAAASPTEEGAGPHDELAELFGLIDDIEREARRISEQAREEAQHRRSDGDERARRILAEANADLEQVRADEAARHRRHIEGEVGDIRAAAAKQAADLGDRARRRLDELADRVVQRIVDGPGTAG